MAAPRDGPDAEPALTPEVRENLSAVLADATRSAELAPALFQLMERLRAEFLEQHTPVRMLSLLEKLRKTMSDLPPDSLNERQRRTLRSELAALRGQAEVLLGEERPAPAPGAQGAVSRFSDLLKRH